MRFVIAIIILIFLILGFIALGTKLDNQNANLIDLKNNLMDIKEELQKQNDTLYNAIIDQQKRLDDIFLNSVEKRAVITAYNATIAQTDGNPTITASGQKIREGIVASNCDPFGTKVIIRGKLYEVQDRGAKRHGCNWFDIFMWSMPEAKSFGRRVETVRIIKKEVT